MEICNEWLIPKSLCRSRAGNHFYGTEYDIWADFWPVGNTEKKRFGADYEQVLRAVFSCFQGKKFKNIVASALKSCIIFLI